MPVVKRVIKRVSKIYMPWGSGVNGTWFTFVGAQTKYLFHTVLCQHKKSDFASFIARRKKFPAEL